MLFVCLFFDDVGVFDSCGFYCGVFDQDGQISCVVDFFEFSIISEGIVDDYWVCDLFLFDKCNCLVEYVCVYRIVEMVYGELFCCFVNVVVEQ